MTKRYLDVGIDLGTSCSVIACDNGMRNFIPSYVGYPKDTVSMKLLGKEAVFGEDALKNRMALDLHRPLENGVLKHSDNPNKKNDNYNNTLHVARKLLQHLLDIVVEHEEGDFCIRGIIGMPAQANMKNKKAIIEISTGILDHVAIVSEPFSVAYGQNLLLNSIIVDIGAGTVDICRMKGTMPNEEDQITTYKGGDYIDQLFYDLTKKRYKNANMTVNMIKRFKEDNASVTKDGERVFIDLPVNGKLTKCDVTDELSHACSSIVPEIVEGISSLIASSDPEFQEEFKRNVVLAGGGSQIDGLKKELENCMKKTLGCGKVSSVEEPLYAGAVGALMLCKDIPEDYWYELNN